MKRGEKGGGSWLTGDDRVSAKDKALEGHERTLTPGRSSIAGRRGVEFAPEIGHAHVAECSPDVGAALSGLNEYRHMRACECRHVRACECRHVRACECRRVPACSCVQVPASAGECRHVRASECRADCRQVRAGPITTTAAYDVDEPEVSAGPRLEVCGETDDNGDEEGSSTFACAAIRAV